MIGDDRVMLTPYGPRRITNPDYNARGLAVDFLEDYIRDEVLPRYANTHTESSGTSLSMAPVEPEPQNRTSVSSSPRSAWRPRAAA